MQSVLPGYQTELARNASQSEFPQLWKGLIGCWMPCAGRQGMKLWDFSGNRRHGTLTNMTLDDWVSGERGFALDFDTTDDRVDVDAIAGAVNPNRGTIAALIYARTYPFTSLASTGSVFDAGVAGSSANGVGICPTSSTAFGIRYRQASTDVTAAISSAPTNTWYHVAGIWNPSVVEIYKNGEMAQSSVQGTLISATLNQSNIGADAIGSEAQRVWDGRIAYVLVYNRDLSVAEIRLLASGASPLHKRKRAVGKAPAAGDQTISPTGIASAEAFGTPHVQLQIDTTGIASQSAFGTAVIALVVSPTGIASLEAFGAAHVQLQINMNGIASTSAFGNATVGTDTAPKLNRMMMLLGMRIHTPKF